MKKIDLHQIRGRWEERHDGMLAGGDDTIISIQIVAEKVNEIIEFLASQKIDK